MNLWAIFFTGLTTGGLSCLAMQGGLLTSVIANQKEDEIDDLSVDKVLLKEKKRQAYIDAQQGKRSTLQSSDWLPIAMFLGAKLFAHVILGALLGALGSVVTFSLGLRLTFQILTSIFMFATAMNLFNVHPIFRYVVIQPPRFLQRLVRNTTKSKAMFAPALLGLMTIFIPCGITQAMEVLAISTGNPVYGALIMFAFVLGTSPLFTLVGVITARLSEMWNQRFLRFAGVGLLLMSLYGVNGVLTVLDSPLSGQRIVKAVTSIGEPPDWYGTQAPDGQAGTAQVVNGKQQVKISIANNGYTPQQLWVRSGTPVELTLESNGTYSCATSFTLKKFNLFAQLKPNDSKTLAFTPTEKGNFTFSCSMGMYTGVMHVI